MRRWLFWIVLLLGCPLSAFAHIGDQSIIYEGLAGAYPVRVIVRPPGVVPGLAEISVRLLQGSATRVTVLPVRYDTGSKGAPAPDVAEPVRGEPNLYNAQLWLMMSGAHSIFVNVEGPAGSGTTVVPINSVATTRLAMQPWFGGALLAFALFLVLALISIVGTAARESVLPPGEQPRSKWRPRIAMICAAITVGAFLFGGRKWWNSVDDDYRNNRLYKPAAIGAQVRFEAGRPLLRLERLEHPRGRPRLIPDHGKLMHAFLIRAPGQDAFAHLHPVRGEKHIYESALPPLLAGDYRLYADVTHESGFTETLVATLSLTNSSSNTTTSDALTDPDDSWHVSTPSAEAGTFTLPDGLTLKWDNADPRIAKTETSLRFRVLETNGAPAVLEPYLGMQAHAVIEEISGQVFTHIHPFGNISMASQQRFVERERTKAGKPNLEVVCGLPAKGDAIVFPYEFPLPGRYRIWIQVKTHGRIMTGFFDATVRGRSETAIRRAR
jgi:hypothetical protein